MRELVVHGELARVVGWERMELKAETVAEALRLVVVQHPEARRVIEGADWVVLEDGKSLDAGELLVHAPAARCIEVLPAPIAAADKVGPVKIILGVLFLGAIFVAPPLLGITLAELSIFGLGAPALIGLGGLVALSGLMSVLAPQPPTDAMEPELPENRQRYLFTGGSNLQGAGHAIPLVYGEHRVGSIRASLALLADRDPAAGYLNLVTIGRLRALDILSEGEIEGLATGDAQSVYLDGVRLRESDGSSNFGESSISLKHGIAAGESHGSLSTLERTFSVGGLVEKKWTSDSDKSDGSVERTISDPGVESVRLTLRTPGLFELDTTDGTYQQRTVQYGIEVKPSGGSWTEALGDTAIGDQVLNTASSVDPATWFPDEGAPSDTDALGIIVSGAIWTSELTGNPDTVTFDFYYRAVGAGSWIGPESYEAPRVREYIDFPFSATMDTYGAGHQWDGLASDRYEGRVEVSGTSGIGSTGTTVFATYDGLVLGSDPELIGLTLQPYEQDILVPDLASYGSAPWTIRMYRRTDDSTDSNVQDKILFQRYAEVVSGEFLMPGTAHALVEASASELQGRVPTVNYELRGIKVRVPTGYTRDTPAGGYADTWPATWDGTWKSTREWSDNPGFILLDMLTAAYGLDLADAEVDMPSLYTAAKWSSYLVDDGDGSTHRRFTFNHVFTTREESFKAAVLVASAMHAQLWWADGRVFVTQDRDDDPVRHFTQANVVGGTFSYEGIARSGRPSLAMVSWRDPGRAYEQATEPVPHLGMQDRFGPRELAVTAIGVTSWGQAYRHGRWILETAARESQQVRFRVGYGDVLMEPGQLVEIADPQRMGARGGGRVASLNPARNTVTIDEPMPDIAAGWVFQVTRADGSLWSGTILSVFATQLLTFAAAIPGTDDLAGRVFAVYASTDTLPIWRVLTITEADDQVYEVLAVEHDPDKRAAVEDLDDEGEEFAIITQAGNLSASGIDTLTAEENADGTWRIVVEFTHTDPDTHWAQLRAVGASTFYATAGPDGRGVIEISSGYGPPEQSFTVSIKGRSFDWLRRTGVAWQDPTVVLVGNAS